MLLHVLIWATALMLFVQSNIFCVAYSVDSNNYKVSPNKRDINGGFMLDEVADFDEIQEPDEEYNGQRNVMLNDISNLVYNAAEQKKNEVSKKTIKYENQQENPNSAFLDKNKISSKEYVRHLITPKFNVPKDIQNNFYLNQGTTTDKSTKNCETTKPPCPKTRPPVPVESDMTPDIIDIPLPTTQSSCNHSSNNPCDKPIQCIQNLNINQQHIQILIQQSKENTTRVETEYPSKSSCVKDKKFNKDYKLSTVAYEPGTTPDFITFQIHKSIHDLNSPSSSHNNILHGKYLNDKLRLLSGLTSNIPLRDLSFSLPEKKYLVNPDKRFINFYPTSEERSSSTKNTILKLNELENEDYVEDAKHTNFDKPVNHLRHLVKNIIENTQEPVELPFNDDYSENPLNSIEKKYISKNYLRQLSNNVNMESTSSQNQNGKLPNLQVYDSGDFKSNQDNQIYNTHPTDRQILTLASTTNRNDLNTRQEDALIANNLNFQDDKIYNRYPTGHQISPLASTAYRDDVNTRQDFNMYTPSNLNNQELNKISNKENINNLEPNRVSNIESVNNIQYQKARSSYYLKALQDYELQKLHQLQPNYIENSDKLAYTDFKPYYAIEETSTNYEPLVKNNNPPNFKLENNNIPYYRSPALSRNMPQPEMDNHQMKLLPTNFKNSQPSRNPTDFRRLYIQQSDENYDFQPNFHPEESVTPLEPILNSRKVQPQIENPPVGAYYYLPNYPIFNTGLDYGLKNGIKSQPFQRRQRKNNFNQYDNPLFNKREINKNILKYQYRPVRKTRQIHSLLPKPRKCGGYKNDSDCKNYLNNANVVLQQVQKLEYALSQQANNSKCTTTQASSCNSGCNSQFSQKKKRNFPFILPIVFANSRSTESNPIINPMSNMQLQVNPELVDKIEAMKLGIQNAMSPVSIVKLNSRESNGEDESKLNPVLLQKLDELKKLIEKAANVRQNPYRGERDEKFKSSEENKLDFDYDVVTKRGIEVQAKLDEAKLNLMSALKPGVENRNAFIPIWTPSTSKQMVQDHKNNVKSIFDDVAENDYLYDDYFNDNEYSNVADRPVKKRSLDFGSSTPVPSRQDIQKRALHLLAMKKLLESIIDIPFFLHQSADNNKSTTNCDKQTIYSSTTNNTMSNENFTSKTPFTIKIDGFVNLSISSMVSLYTPPILSTENVTTTSLPETTANITQSNSSTNTTEKYSVTVNNCSSMLPNNSSNSMPNNSTSSSMPNTSTISSMPLKCSDKMFQELLLKVLNALGQNVLKQLPNFINSSINSEKSLNDSVHQNKTTLSTTHKVDVNATTFSTVNVADKNTTVESTTKKCDKNITLPITSTVSQNTTVHKTVTSACVTTESETTKCSHKSSKHTTEAECSTKKPVHVFVLSTRSSVPDEEISFFGDVISLTPSDNEPVVVRKRSKEMKPKKCCTTKEYHKSHQCTNQSSTTPEAVEGNPIDITKERLSLLLNIIRKSSTISPTTNCTSTTTACPTTCSNRKCVEKRQAPTGSFKQPNKVRSPKNPNLQSDSSAVKLISLAEHSLMLAEKYMQNQKSQESHNLERGDVYTTTQSYTFDQNYTPNTPIIPRNFKYNLFTSAPNLFPMYVVNSPKPNLPSSLMVVPFADVPTSTPSMVITTNGVLNFNHTTVISGPHISNGKNATTCSTSLQPVTKKEDTSEIPDYVAPMYSDVKETEDNQYNNVLKSNFYDDLNSDYSDDADSEKVATSRSERLKRDIKVIHEIQDIVDKMKLETKINTLKENRRPVRSVNIRKRSIKSFKSLLPDDENTNLIETAKYNNPKGNFVKPFDMYVIGNTDLTKDYKKRFLMFRSGGRKRKHRKKKEREWKRLYGRSATKNPEHFLNQKTQNL